MPLIVFAVGDDHVHHAVAVEVHALEAQHADRVGIAVVEGDPVEWVGGIVDCRRRARQPVHLNHPVAVDPASHQDLRLEVAVNIARDGRHRARPNRVAGQVVGRGRPGHAAARRAVVAEVVDAGRRRPPVARAHQAVHVAIAISIPAVRRRHQSYVDAEEVAARERPRIAAVARVQQHLAIARSDHALVGRAIEATGYAVELHRFAARCVLRYRAKDVVVHDRAGRAVDGDHGLTDRFAHVAHAVAGHLRTRAQRHGETQRAEGRAVGALRIEEVGARQIVHPIGGVRKRWWRRQRRRWQAWRC